MPSTREFENFPGGEKSAESEASQNLQARTLEGNTAPHCKQVFVTGVFCAADASTPVGVNTVRIAVFPEVKETSEINCG
ncbi:MAG: hypothetical protein PVS2B2_11690 [Candidatus Acidiferrum sp.]